MNVENNSVHGVIHCDQEELLFLSIPKDDGWKAYIDNRRADIINTNLGMMGILVPEGTHEISLKFVPKGFYVGVGTCFLSVCIYLYILYQHKRFKRSI